MEIFLILLPVFLVGVAVCYLVRLNAKKRQSSNGNTSEKTYASEGIGVGMALGVAVAIALNPSSDQIAYYTGCGAGIGMLLGMTIGQGIKKDSKE